MAAAALTLGQFCKQSKSGQTLTLEGRCCMGQRRLEREHWWPSSPVMAFGTVENYQRPWSGQQVVELFQAPSPLPPDRYLKNHNRSRAIALHFLPQPLSRNAGVAIQFYGTAVEHIVANNDESKRRWILRYRASRYAGGVAPQLNVQLLDNRVAEGWRINYHFGPNAGTPAPARPRSTCCLRCSQAS